MDRPARDAAGEESRMHAAAPFCGAAPAIEPTIGRNHMTKKKILAALLAAALTLSLAACGGGMRPRRRNLPQ